jgi:hypothetical protein
VGRGEGGEVGENVAAAGPQAVGRMMAGGDERAVDAQFARDFQVVPRVADEEDIARRDAEQADEVLPESDLAICMDVIEAGVWSK